MNYPELSDGQECKACQTNIDEADEGSFVAIGDERLRSMHKPLIVFFLYSGVCNYNPTPIKPHPTNSLLHQDNSIGDKICMDCFDKFKGITEFYNKCKNSRDKYTPCFRASSGSCSEANLPTPRILSTETPDITSSESNRPSPEILSSNSRSALVQTDTWHQDKLKTPEKKKTYQIHYDLGIRLPKPLVRSKGCFSSDDYCYLMLQDEFDRENAKDAASAELKSQLDNTPPTCKLGKYPPISKPYDAPIKIDRGHPHMAKCPFCPSLIPRKHPRF